MVFNGSRCFVSSFFFQFPGFLCFPPALLSHGLAKGYENTTAATPKKLAHLTKRLGGSKQKPESLTITFQVPKPLALPIRKRPVG